MNLWKRKLAAYLHDPPSKALDIRHHGERSDAAFRQAGYVDSEIGEYFNHADHAGAAADRLPFPNSLAANLACAFDGVRNAFRHPLSGDPFPFHAPFPSTDFAAAAESSVQPRLSDECLESLPDEPTRWRARFFAHWRLWSSQAAQSDYRFAFLPADTRIPDHTIWTHMQVVSALDGCLNSRRVWRPAFLKFQLGPVQEFIAAARSTRDLWSGSYLLSWLMASGLKALSGEIGPDAVIYPNLHGQPLFDLHWRNDLWEKTSIGGRKVWDSIGWSGRDLLTPNLPNVFLAIVPADRAQELGKRVRDTIQNEWRSIATQVWDSCKAERLTADEGNFTEDERKKRFDSQIAQFLSLSWASTCWPDSLEDALKLAAEFAPDMPVQKARERIQAVITMATRQMPEHHRDRRFYTDNTKAQLNNTGLAWCLLAALNSWQLDGVRQARCFQGSPSGGWKIGTFSNKDSLTGREEAVAGGREWVNRAKQAGNHWPFLFKKDDWLGAPTLVKRVWHEAYLAKVWNLAATPKDFPMPDTRGIADHKPNENGDDDATEKLSREESRYFAVLALDGDEIGKWVSGDRNPTYATQLAGYEDGSQTLKLGAKPYFERPEFADFLGKKRLLSPSFHLQFSSALSHFALRCARPIVESYDGRLIYAGGDDVLALLPADTALACAKALRLAFQGSPDLPQPQAPEGSGRRAQVASSGHPGFLVRLDDAGDMDRSRLRLEKRFTDENGRAIPFIVPGPEADCSVGIAVAHFKAPLQDVVRAAHAAQKRAKEGMDRSAVAVTLMKHSGETIEWAAKWNGGLDLLLTLGEALQASQLSRKFPHRWAEFLAAYISQPTPLTQTSGAVQDADGFDADAILRIEFEHTLTRQRGPAFPGDSATRESLLTRLRSGLELYLFALNRADITKAEDRLQSCIALCQTAAFTHRISEGSQPNPPTS